jgi:hypothetical protein
MPSPIPRPANSRTGATNEISTAASVSVVFKGLRHRLVEVIDEVKDTLAQVFFRGKTCAA